MQKQARPKNKKNKKFNKTTASDSAGFLDKKKQKNKQAEVSSKCVCDTPKAEVEILLEPSTKSKRADGPS